MPRAGDCVNAGATQAGLESTSILESTGILETTSIEVKEAK